MTRADLIFFTEGDLVSTSESLNSQKREFEKVHNTSAGGNNLNPDDDCVSAGTGSGSHLG